jgi:hypothetical protein
VAETGALREALRLAQRGEAEAALALRRRALGLEAAPDARGVDKVDVGARFRALAALEPLRDGDAAPSPAAVDAALAGIDLRGAPDLERAAERLRVAGRAAEPLWALERDPALSGGLCQVTAALLRAAPARAAKLRAACLLTIETGGFDASRVARTVARLRADLPVLERLEGPWLRAVEAAARPAPAPGDRGRVAIAALFLGYKAWAWAAQAVAAVRE